MKFVVNCISELNKVAKTIIESLDSNNVICFYGKMGVGKTALIKAICCELGVKENVSSPTFSIVNEYVTEEGTSVYHFDFYRLENEEELWILVLRNIFTRIVCVLLNGQKRFLLLSLRMY